MSRKWVNIKVDLPSKTYTCGYCGQFVASSRGYDSAHDLIYVCPHCERATFFEDKNKQFPGSAYGNEVKNLDPVVGRMYNEARKSYSVGAYTASVLCSRKLLMNIAHTQGAPDKQTFKFYVEWLRDNHYLPPGGEKWVDHVRNKGNEATHEIPQMEAKDAETLIHFLEMLLKFIYEFPAKLLKGS
jgi:hypothetical protein